MGDRPRFVDGVTGLWQTRLPERWLVDRASEQLSNGKIRYELKTPYGDGTTDVIFACVDFIARLAAWVPGPGVNLTRFHGVFAPNNKRRAVVTPAKRGKGSKSRLAEGQGKNGRAREKTQQAQGGHCCRRRGG